MAGSRTGWVWLCAGFIVGCGGSGDGGDSPSSDAGTHGETSSSIDSAVDDSTLDASHDVPSIDTSTDVASDTGSSDDTSVADVPLWLDPDAHWDTPPSDAWFDETTGCEKIWKTGTVFGAGAPSSTFGASGAQIANLSIEQGDLVGDFDLTLDIGPFTRTASGWNLLAIDVEKDFFAQEGAGSGFDEERVHAAYDDRSLDLTTYDASGKSLDDFHWTDSTSATLHIQRTGLSLTATLTASSGVASTTTFAAFGSGPLTVKIAQGAGATAALRRFTIVGGGGVVRSDDFSCDSFY